jgi:ACT domain-containing protein
MVPDDDNFLTPNGKLLMKNLGKRMSLRFKNLKKSINNSLQINILTTNITRTIQSAQEFLIGFLEESDIRPQIKQIKDNEDYLLKFPDLCQLFLKEIDSNSNACPEVKIFENSKISKDLDDIISSRMNLDIYQIKKSIF